MITAITGHRPTKLGGYNLPNPVYNTVMTRLEETLRTVQPALVLTGMALGVDQWAAQLCINMNIPFDAVIAFEGYELKWPTYSQKVYRGILKSARKIHMLHPGPYRPHLLHARNHWMVDRSNNLLAVWDGKPDSGTAACVQYALTRNPPKPVAKIELPDHIWKMAQDGTELSIKGLEGLPFQDVDLKRRNLELVEKIRSIEAELKAKRAPPPPASTSFEYRRFVDVGDEDS